jgi:hypothetical protein
MTEDREEDVEEERMQEQRDARYWQLWCERIDLLHRSSAEDLFFPEWDEMRADRIDELLEEYAADLDAMSDEELFPEG